MMHNHPSHSFFRPSISFLSAGILLGLITVVFAQCHRGSDAEGILLARYGAHAILGGLFLFAWGMVYFRFPQLLDGADGHFHASLHLGLSFFGILAMMSSELLVPETVLGWGGESLAHPAYFFLGISTQVIIFPMGILLLTLGQISFFYHLGTISPTWTNSPRYTSDGHKLPEDFSGE